MRIDQSFDSQFDDSVLSIFMTDFDDSDDPVLVAAQRAQFRGEIEVPQAQRTVVRPREQTLAVRGPGSSREISPK